MCITGRKKNKADRRQGKISDGDRRTGPGRISVVGIGPGSKPYICPKALELINGAEVVAGYSLYLELIKDLLPGKQVISSGMTGEIERAQAAVDAARSGNDVCVVSSGDPGVYGMAGLVLELLSEKDLKDLDPEIVPGVTAATMAASLLGAPLAHDFAVISLSDLLTDLDLILKRVELACRGDFVIVLYNPRGKKRIAPLEGTWKILMRYRRAETPVGIVRNAGRAGQAVTLCVLDQLLDQETIDMKSIVIIGNSKTYVKDTVMVTPRGYIHG